MFFRWRSIKYDKSFALPFSIAATIMMIILLIFTNLYYSPSTIWYFYPIFAIIWWPMSLIYAKLKKRVKKEGE